MMATLLCTMQIPTDKLHVWHKGSSFWEGYVGAETVHSYAWGIRQVGNEADCWRSSDSSRARPATSAAAPAWLQLLQTVCFIFVCDDDDNDDIYCTDFYELWTKKKLPLLFLLYFWFLLTKLNISFLSLLQSEVISAYIWNNIYHLTCTALPHYLAKIMQ